jgi:hypothetical protein
VTTPAVFRAYTIPIFRRSITPLGLLTYSTVLEIQDFIRIPKQIQYFENKDKLQSSVFSDLAFWLGYITEISVLLLNRRRTTYRHGDKKRQGQINDPALDV